jgi:4-nitrophenyl phosphatase
MQAIPQEVSTTAMASLDAIRSFILDMDGVLYRARKPLPGAREFLARLDRTGTPFLLVTNNGTRTPGQYVARLAEMGIAIEPERLLTSAQATARYLACLAPPGTRMFVIGMDGVRTALVEQGFELVDSRQVDYVVVGVDFRLTYPQLRTAALAIRDGARFVATNPDRTFPAEDGLIPGCGAILAALEAATDVRPTVIGKPAPVMFEQALVQLGTPRQETAVVGDSLETDIRGGQAAGLTTLMVLTGVSSRDDLERSPLKPDRVFDSIAALDRAWQSPVPSPQSPVPSPQSPVPSPQSPVSSPQSPVPSSQSPVPGSSGLRTED